MTQKVLKVGDSLAVTIPKKSAEEIGLKAGDLLDVKTSRRGITIKPKQALSKDDQKIAQLTLGFINRYRKDLERLSKR